MGRTKSASKPARMRSEIHDQELVLEEKRLRNDGTDAARTEQAGQGSSEMDKKMTRLLIAGS